MPGNSKTSWPSLQDFSEAIQTPQLTIQDPELKVAEPQVDDWGIPFSASGNFAVVFRLHVPSSGRHWAVKCFRQPLDQQKARYRAISNHLRGLDLPYTVDFEYIADGIRVGAGLYPILKMEWVEGDLLHRWVDEFQNDAVKLQQLFDEWLLLASALRTARIAHGDLQHGNVIVRQTANGSVSLILIDYDGLFVPALEASPPTELGHPAYQHPRRFVQKPFNPEIDRFSVLAIACAIRALSLHGSELWYRYNNFDNLLFLKSDFEAPNKSELLHQLWNSKDTLTRNLAGHLIRSTDLEIGQEPFLPDLLQQRPDAALLPNEKLAVEAILHRQTRPKAASVVCPKCGSPTPEGEMQAHVRECRSDRKTRPASVEAPATSRTYPRAERSLRPALNPRRLSRNDLIGIFLVVATVAIALLLPQIYSLLHFVALDWSARDEATGQRSVEAITPAEVITPVEIDMVLIPAGEFTMGSPLTEVFIPRSDLQRGRMQRFNAWNGPVERHEHEGPQHRVRISSPFYIGKHEVTQREYETVTGTNLAFHSHEDMQKYGIDAGTLPIEHVTWYDAVYFCNRLSMALDLAPYYSLNDAVVDEGNIIRAEVAVIGGAGYRLPTEAEWEYACRAGTDTPFHFGSTLDPHDAWILSKANFNCVGKSPVWKTTPVGSYAPNAFGLFDMHGNVAEWCEDWYGEAIYQKDGALPVAVDPRGAPDGEFRIYRGGSWHDLSHLGRSARRTGGQPDYYTYELGFRVARTKSRSE